MTVPGPTSAAAQPSPSELGSRRDRREAESFSNSSTQVAAAQSNWQMHFFASSERHNRYLLRLCLVRLMTEIADNLTGR